MPLSLLNIESGKPELVEDYQVEELIRNGTHVGYGEQSAGILLEDGTRYNIPSSKLSDALTLPGVQYQSLDMAETDEFAESGLGQLAAGTAGAARSLTFGGSDWLLKGMGADDTARVLREKNPWTSLIGEGVGIAAPLLIGGPLGAITKTGKVAKVAGSIGKTGVAVTPAMKAARTAGALPRFAAETGVKAGRWVQNALHPRVRDTTVRRFFADRISQGVATGVESAFYAGGMIASDAALSTGGTDPLTLEKIGGAMTSTIILGGALGAAIGSGTLKTFRKRGPLKPTRAERKASGPRGTMLGARKRWIPHSLPHVAAVRAVMDLNP